MFEQLSERLEGILGRLRGRGTLRAEDVDEALRDIRRALLEADVNVEVARAFVGRVRERCVGASAHAALTPAQQVVKAVHDELVAALGGQTVELEYPAKPPTVVLLAGLQGSGKTTTAAKLALWFKKKGRRPVLVGADLQRPAAVDQLRTLGERIGVPVFSEPTDPIRVAKSGVEAAKAEGADVVIVDTAGRLAIDEELMDEVRRIGEAVSPHYRFLVVDAMTGQDAVRVAERFHAAVGIDGVILTKLDGDARGGAALSVKETIGRPIFFASSGEKVEDFDLFHPDRLAGRILGMGDVLTLIEKAEEAYERDKAAEAARKLVEGRFTLDDFLEQLQAVKKMGPISNLVSMLPGVPRELRNQEIDDREVRRVEAIIRSMTPEERVRPEIIDGSRRERIARGSGTSPSDVSDLVQQFLRVRKMLNNWMGLGTKRMAAARKRKSGRGKGKVRKGGRVTPKGGLPRPGMSGPPAGEIDGFPASGSPLGFD
ncbi:MAG: signal recognition particle protein [Acidimicrobiales bacterium]|nr:MAG: signal recognition particle protein [Acidimicrobiales bacterium]